MEETLVLLKEILFILIGDVRVQKELISDYNQSQNALELGASPRRRL